MNKHKIIGMLFVLLGVLVILGSAYVVITYANEMLGAIVDFATTTDFVKLRNCGVEAPPQLDKIKGELTTVILPFLYLGIPLILIILSALMFLGGFYYRKGKTDHDTKKNEELERKMLRKAVTKLESEKPSPPPSKEPEPEEEEETEG